MALGLTSRVGLIFLNSKIQGWEVSDKARIWADELAKKTFEIVAIPRRRSSVSSRSLFIYNAHFSFLFQFSPRIWIPARQITLAQLPKWSTNSVTIHWVPAKVLIRFLLWVLSRLLEAEVEFQGIHSIENFFSLHAMATFAQLELGLRKRSENSGTIEIRKI